MNQWNLHRIKKNHIKRFITLWCNNTLLKHLKTIKKNKLEEEFNILRELKNRLLELEDSINWIQPFDFFIIKFMSDKENFDTHNENKIMSYIENVNIKSTLNIKSVNSKIKNICNSIERIYK